MKDNRVLDTLRKSRVFGGLPDDKLQRFAAAADFVEFPEGAVVFREGDPTSCVLFVSTGSAALELCAPGVGCRQILTAGPGELLGWSAILGQPEYTATARALEQLQAVKIETPRLQDILANDYQIAYELMRRTALTLAKRLRVARLQAADLYGPQPSSTEPKEAV